MSEPKRFHPLALIIYLFNGIKNTFFLFILILLDNGFQTTFDQVAFAIVLMSIIIYALWKYFSETYQVSPQKIVIYRGVWNKRETDIPYERIQTIKQRQWFFFKPFHVTQLLIETAGGAGPNAEASMPAVDIQMLEMIEKFRHGESQENEETNSSAAKEMNGETWHYRVTHKQIFLFGFTDLSIIASLLALIVFVSEFIPQNWISAATSILEQVWRAGVLTILGIVFIGIIVGMVVSLAKTYIQYYNFRVSRGKNTLTIESGLFERNTQKIPLNKIQGLKVEQQILRKLLGLSTVELLLAGGQEGDNASTKRVYILPIISDSELYETLDELLPEWSFSEPDIHYVSRDKLWYFFRWKLMLIPIAIGLAFVTGWLALATLVILALLLIHSWMDCKLQGYAVQSADRICVQRVSSFSKVQRFVERTKIQASSEKTTKWLYPKHIGHIDITIKAGFSSEIAQLRFIDYSVIQKLSSFYEYRTELKD